MKPIILLDMDGVIADWFNATLGLYGINTTDLDLPRPWEYAIHTWISKYLKIPISNERLIGRVDVAAEQIQFWSHVVEPYNYTEALLERLAQYETDIFITTSTERFSPLAYSQKVQWLDRYFPQLPRSKIMLGKAKYLMARRNHILIDDYDNNVDSFIEHGGKGILFPQPWNTAHEHSNTVQDKLDYVFARIDLAMDQIHHGA
jgi:5'(3')-deoxyribonucleotidase